MYQSAGNSTLGFVFAGAALLLILLPVVRAIKAGYGAIALFVIVEMGLVIMASMVGRDAWIFPVGWGFVAILAAIADVGADLRRALEARAGPAQALRSSDAETR